jgi:aryl-alcohol dehydrogenase-like predicted oxidoreductase
VACMHEPRRVLTPDSIRRECDASLRRLGVERIDLYQFHWPDNSGTPVEDSWAAMVTLVVSHDTGVICYSPMQSGLLTDSFTADRVSSPADQGRYGARGPCQRPVDGTRDRAIDTVNTRKWGTT